MLSNKRQRKYPARINGLRPLNIHKFARLTSLSLCLLAPLSVDFSQASPLPSEDSKKPASGEVNKPGSAGKKETPNNMPKTSGGSDAKSSNDSKTDSKIDATINPKSDSKVDAKSDSKQGDGQSPTLKIPGQHDVPVQNKVYVGGPLGFDVVTNDNLLTVLKDISDSAGVTIIADETVKDTPVSLSLVKPSLEDVLRRAAGGYYWKKRPDGSYIVSAATATAPFFLDFAKVNTYHPRNQTVESIMQLVAPAIEQYVKGDKLTNTLTITAPEDKLAVILDMIKAIDSRARQFVVEALITELNGGNTAEYGFSWNWHNFGIDNNLNLNYARATATDVATLKNMIGTQKATLRANPRVAAFEGRETQLNVGTDTYITIQTGILTFQTSQIQVIKTGVTLKVTGLIGDDGMITLMIDSEVGDFTTPVNGYPTVTTRKAHTNVRVKSGETIVIGGLIQDTDSNITNKIPFLGDLPLVGQAFRTRSKVRKRTDIVMMLTPRITEDGAGIEAISEKMALPPDGPKAPPVKAGPNTDQRPLPPPRPTMPKQTQRANKTKSLAQPLQICCNNNDYSSSISGNWQHDSFYHGGKLYTLRQGFSTNTSDDELYSSFRSGEKKFGYRIPLPNGNYLLNLGFVEPTCMAVGQRVFDVCANGQPLITDLDVFAEAGGQGKVLVKKEFVTVTEGRLDLDLTGSIYVPILSTIQVVPIPSPVPDR